MTCSTEIADILTYDHSSLDSILNYIALFITFLPVVHIHRQMILDDGQIFFRKYFCYFLTLFLFGFQIGLCLLVHCRGISIIWSAYCGYSFTISILVRKNRPIKQLNESKYPEIVLLFASLLCSVILWIYYAVISDLLTSIAHLCALLLGILIGEIFLRTSPSVVLSKDENTQLLSPS